MRNQSMVEQVEGKQTAVSRWSGLFLVMLGGVVLGLTLLKGSLENWWALFILLPALVLFGSGWVIPRGENGRFGRLSAGRFSLISRLFFATGFVVLVVAGMFLVNLDWSVWWPLMIVAPGVALTIAAGKSSPNPTSAAWIGFVRWLSATMIALGGVFLAHTLGWIDLNTFEQFQWWGVFIAFPAMGALLQAVRLNGRLGTMSLSVIALLGIAFFGGATAVIELLGISWTSFYGITATSTRLSAGVFFIGSGVVLLVNGLRSTSE